MTYTVQYGDSLSKIARDQLGDMNLWPAIAKLNNITNPDLIRPGDQLNLDVKNVGSGSASGASASMPGQGTTSNKTVWIIVGLIVVVLVIIGGYLVYKGKFKMPKI